MLILKNINTFLSFINDKLYILENYLIRKRGE